MRESKSARSIKEDIEALPVLSILGREHSETPISCEVCNLSPGANNLLIDEGWLSSQEAHGRMESPLHSHRPYRTMRMELIEVALAEIRGKLLAKWCGCQTRRNSRSTLDLKSTTQHKEPHLPVSLLVELPNTGHSQDSSLSDFFFTALCFTESQLGTQCHSCSCGLGRDCKTARSRNRG